MSRCSRPRHRDGHLCVMPQPGHKVHVCDCHVPVIWNDDGLTFAEWRQQQHGGPPDVETGHAG